MGIEGDREVFALVEAEAAVAAGDEALFAPADGGEGVFAGILEGVDFALDFALACGMDADVVGADAEDDAVAVGLVELY